MHFKDEIFERFRQDRKQKHGEDMSFIEAKERYLQLAHLFWILAHKVPKEGDPPRDPPPPPWL